MITVIYDQLVRDRDRERLVAAQEHRAANHARAARAAGGGRACAHGGRA